MLTLSVVIPWWDYLSVRDVLILSMSSKALQLEITPNFLQWLGSHVCPCMWHVCKVKAMPTRIIYHKPKDASFNDMQGYTLIDKLGRMYKAARPSPDAALRILQTRLCRECLSPTTRKARSKSGRFVLVCKACSMDPSSPSAMCDRRELLTLNGGSRGYTNLLKSLHVCKIGGNRAILYWRTDVEQALRERCNLTG